LNFICISYGNIWAKEYLVGVSASLPEYPIIVDLEEESVYYSKIPILDSIRSQVFFDEKTRCFVFSVESQGRVYVYSESYNSDKLSQPVWATKKFEDFQNVNTLWHPKSQRLFLIGYQWFKFQRFYKLVFFDFSEGAQYQTIEFHKALNSVKGSWILGNSLYILTKDNSSNKNETKYNILIVDVLSLKVSKSTWGAEASHYFGILDKKALAFMKNMELYEFTSSGSKKIGIVKDNIGHIYYGDRTKGNGYSFTSKIIRYGEQIAESDTISKYSWVKGEEIETLFEGKKVGWYFTPLFLESDLDLNFQKHISTEGLDVPD